MSGDFAGDELLPPLPFMVEKTDRSRQPRATEPSSKEHAPIMSAPSSSLPEEPGAWLGALWQKHSPGLVLYARQKTNAAEDVVQAAFLNLARQEQRPADPVTWLYRVVRNEATSQWRQEQRRQRREQALASQRPEWFVPVQESALDQANLREALLQLEPNERELIVLHVWGSLTFAQLGEVLEISSSTAQRHYTAALERLRNIMLGSTKSKE